jgi:hypothetical protein
LALQKNCNTAESKEIHGQFGYISMLLEYYVLESYCVCETLANVGILADEYRNSGIKIFNNLPSSLKSLMNEKAEFKVALKRYLTTHSLMNFYCLKMTYPFKGLCTKCKLTVLIYVCVCMYFLNASFVLYMCLCICMTYSTSYRHFD